MVRALRSEPYAESVPPPFELIQTLTRTRLYAIISALEVDLRLHLREWFLPTLSTPDVFGARLEVVASRARKDGADATDPYSLIDYIDWADGFTILNSRPKLLPSEIATTVRTFTPRFEASVAVRNRVMHTRPLLEDDHRLVADLARDLDASSDRWSALRQVLRHLSTDPLWEPDVAFDPSGGSLVESNLPVPDFDETGLLGRKEARDQVLKYLLERRYPVITLVGEGGVGKTALAVKCLYDLIDDPACPYLAVLWVSLKTERLTAESIESLTATAADLVGITDALSQEVGLDGHDGGAALGSMLAEIPALIVIDNVETADPAEVVRLIETLPPEARFLLTSRVGLGELEKRIPLGPLKPQPAAVMFRKLADRRGLQRFSTCSDAQCTEIIERLAYRPLAIRWFIEAVAAGGQPDSLLSDQTQLLHFCLGAIYDDLSSEARSLALGLLESDRALSPAELALLINLSKDDVVRGLHDLDRRSLITVALQAEGAGQIYQLTDFAAQYLASVSGSDDERLALRERTRRQKRDEDSRRRTLEKGLAPGAIVIRSDQDAAAAGELKRALRFSKAGELDAARASIGRARDADPGYFEVMRVAAFIESNERPEAASRLYDEALSLAAPGHERALVAYWASGHLAKQQHDPDAALPLALEAHAALGLPETAMRVGEVRLYLGEFDIAETMMRQVVEEARAPRLMLIAQTSLIEVARRRAEQAGIEGRDPLAAVLIDVAAAKEGVEVAATGIRDARLQKAILRVAWEAWRHSSRAPAGAALDDAISELLGYLDDWRPIAEGYGVASEIQVLAREIGGATNLSEYVKQTASYLSLSSGDTPGTDDDARLRGSVVRWSDKGFGFVEHPNFEQGLFFHRSAVRGAEAARLLLMPGCAVSFTMGEVSGRPVALDLCPELSETRLAAMLEGRSGEVESIRDAVCVVRELETGGFVTVTRESLADQADWEHLKESRRVTFDIDAGATTAKRGTLRRLSQEGTSD